jgi:hypothetical protein
MIHAADYRAKAEDCARRAGEAQDEYHRKNFLELAAMWSEMADKADGRIPAEGERSEEDVVGEALETIRSADANR